MSLAELDVRVKLVAFLAIMVAVLLISHSLGSAPSKIGRASCRERV